MPLSAPAAPHALRCSAGAALRRSRCAAAAAPLAAPGQRLRCAAPRRAPRPCRAAAGDAAPPPPPPPRRDEPLLDPQGAAKVDLSATMLDDIARLKAKRAAEKAAAAAAGDPSESEAAAPEWETQLNRILIADFFVVVAFGLILVVGVIEQSTNKTTVVADFFFKIWPVLVQPALGVLMAGSIATGAFGFLRDKGLLK